jgi:predicted Ser/Thr protein kinase
VRRVPARGEAEVWLALGPRGAPAALKRLAADAPARLRAALRHEGEVLQMLEVAGMPWTPRVLDADPVADAWLALSWCDGVDLVAWSHEPPRSLVRRARVAERLVGLYVELHERGVLHGDVHPLNVRIDQADRLWLVDFAAARLLGATDDLARIAAEQQAVAAMACRIVLGDSGMGVLRGPDAGAPRLRDAWPSLERVLARAAAADPAHRWPDLAAFARALADALARGPRV